jgi:uncharacterized membrane protein
MHFNLTKFIYILGSAVCHQLPQRSFFAGSLQICLCARCEGIYLGFLISAVLLFLLFRKKQSDLPPVYIIVIAILFIVSTITDGLLSYLGLINTNNFTRFITGYLAGSGAVIITYPVFNYQYYLDSTFERIFSKKWQFVLFVAINLVFITSAILNVGFINIVYFYISPLAVLFTFFSVNILVVLFIPRFSKKATRFFSKYLILPFLVSIMLTAIELFLSYRLHIFFKTL